MLAEAKGTARLRLALPTIFREAPRKGASCLKLLSHDSVRKCRLLRRRAGKGALTRPQASLWPLCRERGRQTRGKAGTIWLSQKPLLSVCEQRFCGARRSRERTRLLSLFPCFDENEPDFEPRSGFWPAEKLAFSIAFPVLNNREKCGRSAKLERAAG